MPVTAMGMPMKENDASFVLDEITISAAGADAEMKDGSDAGS